jgi:hypothetical protein
MKRGSWADDPALLWQVAINGVIKGNALQELGVASGTITYRCRDGGPWQRILPGVVLLHNGFPSAIQRNTAALLYGGDEAVLSGHASLGAHGYATSASKSDVLILLPPERHRAASSFVTVERTWRMPAPVLRGSLRCAPLVRSLVDAARRAPTADRCRALFADAIQRGDVSVEELAVELAEGPRRNSGDPRRALAELGDNAHSIAEIDAQKLYARTGLPAMAFNKDLFTSAGEFIACPDGWIDEVGLAWEVDSLAHHLSPADHEATVLRRALLRRHGVVVVEHLPKTIRTNSALVMADLRSEYQVACARPRPQVYLQSGIAA